MTKIFAGYGCAVVLGIFLMVADVSAQGNWPAVNFDKIPFGTSSGSQGTGICSTGGTINYTSFKFSEATDYCLTSNTCSSVPDGQCCSINFKFTPKAGGARQGFFYAYNNSVVNPIIIPLNGTGVINPNQILSEAQYQTTPPAVAGVAYGNCMDSSTGYTIKNKGCALTSLANAINYILKSAPVPSTLETPVTLQNFVRSIGGYSTQSGNQCTKGPGNDVKFSEVVSQYRLVTPSQRFSLVWKPLSISNNSDALDQVLSEGYPVILGINQKKNTAACNVAQPKANCYYLAHYVLAIGPNMQIIDPESSANTTYQALVNYRAGKGKTVFGWVARGQVVVKNGAFNYLRQPVTCSGSFASCAGNSWTAKNTIWDALGDERIDAGANPRKIKGTDDESFLPDAVSENQGSFSVIGNNNIDFQMIDPSGRITGYNSSTGQIDKGIPESDYNIESLTGADEPDDDTGSTIGEVSHPLNGAYSIVVKSGQSTGFTLTINRLNRYGQPLTPLVLNDSIQAGETKTYSFNYSFTKSPLDFDKDGNVDISIFRPSVGEWWINRSSTGATFANQFGSSSDKLTPADFTGDGKTDIAFWRPSDGYWYVLRSEDGSYFSFPFGASGDVPQVGDFDGDGLADEVIYRPSTNIWYIQKSSGGVDISQFGAAGDVPIAADYDGDGKTDIAIFRSSNNSWWYVRSSDNTYRVFQFALGTDKPVVGDWTGDGKADLAVYRPTTGEWFVQKSEDGSYYGVPFGTSGDIPAPGDYDGDGKFDTAVFRPSTRTWYINRSTAGILITGFGVAEDKPLAGSFIP